MKTILLAVTCLACGVVLGFVLNSLLFFGGVSWPGKLADPTMGEPDTASLSMRPSSSPTRQNSQQANKVVVSEPATQSSPAASSTFNQQQSTSDSAATIKLSYDDLRQFSPESSISDQQQLLALIANADLAQITQAFAEVPDDNSRIHEQQWIIGLLAQRRVELDPQAVLQEIEQSLLSPQGRYGDNMALYLLAKSYARQQPQEMSAWLAELPASSVDPERTMAMVVNLGEVAPESAIEMIRQNPALASGSEGGLEGVLYMWADKDPAAALRWLQGQDDERMVKQHAESIISMLVYRDPEAARAAAQEYPGLVPESLFVSHEVGTLAESDPMAAFALAQSITDPDEAGSAKQMVLYTWSMQDPMAAIEFVNTLPEGNERAMYASMVAGSMGASAGVSPIKREEMLAWSETLSPDLKMQVLQPLIMQWAEQEPQAAMQWWNSQPESAEKLALLQSIAWNIPAQQAIELFPDADESTQVALSSTIIRNLYENDPIAAQSWYDELPDNAVKQRSLYELFMMTAQTNPQQALMLIDDAMANGAASRGAGPEMVFRLLPFAGLRACRDGTKLVANRKSRRGREATAHRDDRWCPQSNKLVPNARALRSLSANDTRWHDVLDGTMNDRPPLRLSSLRAIRS